MSFTKKIGYFKNFDVKRGHVEPHKLKESIMTMPKTNLYENKSFSTLIDCIDQIEDQRMQGKIKYPLRSVILMVVCATIGGADNWVEVMHFCKDHKEWFYITLGITCGIPSHDTFGDIFNRIHPEQLSFWLILWIEEIMPQSLEGDMYHCDGKTLRAYGSEDPLTLVRAWSKQLQSTIGITKVTKGSNEIIAIPQLLQKLDLKGKVVTLDAIGTQTEIVNRIIDQQGDYVIALKSNQHSLHSDVKLFMDDMPSNVPYTVTEQYEKNHGRIEKRICIATDRLNWLPQKRKWKKLHSLVKVETTITKKNKVYHGQRYFISSLPADSDKLLFAIRSHWSIENNLHWTLDRYFNDDRSTIRDAFGATNASFMRSFAVSILQNDMDSLPNRSFPAKRQAVNRNPNFLVSGLLNKG